MKFELIKKDYQREIYQSPFTWKNIPLIAQVSMHYHTFLRFWDAEYAILYGNNYSYGTPDINRKSDITGRNGRKTARAFAKKCVNYHRLETVACDDDSKVTVDYPKLR